MREGEERVKVMVAEYCINPLDDIGICLNKQKLMYSVLASSLTPIQILMDLWRLWTHFYVSVAG